MRRTLRQSTLPMELFGFLALVIATVIIEFPRPAAIASNLRARFTRLRSWAIAAVRRQTGRVFAKRPPVQDDIITDMPADTSGAVQRRPQMGLGGQFVRLTGEIRAQAELARDAGDNHQRAHQQLYALRKPIATLRADLTTVMDRTPQRPMNFVARLESMRSSNST